MAARSSGNAVWKIPLAIMPECRVEDTARCGDLCAFPGGEEIAVLRARSGRCAERFGRASGDPGAPPVGVADMRGRMQGWTDDR